MKPEDIESSPTSWAPRDPEKEHISKQVQRNRCRLLPARTKIMMRVDKRKGVWIWMGMGRKSGSSSAVG